MRIQRRAELQVVAAALLFSTGGAAVKACSLSGWQVAGLRSGIAAVVIMLALPAARRGWSGSTALVGLAYAATLILYVAANKLTTAANTIFLQSTAPLYILFLGPWLLREAIRRVDFGIMALLVGGSVILVVATPAQQNTAPNVVVGNLLAMLAGVGWALTLIGLRWIASRRRGSENASIAAVAMGNLTAFLVCLPWMLPVTEARVADWALVAFLGVFQIGLAYVLLTAGIRHVSALETSILLLIEPVMNPVWALLVQGERPGAWAFCGGGLILAATVLKSRSAPSADISP